MDIHVMTPAEMREFMQAAKEKARYQDAVYLATQIILNKDCQAVMAELAITKVNPNVQGVLEILKGMGFDWKRIPKMAKGTAYAFTVNKAVKQVAEGVIPEGDQSETEIKGRYSLALEAYEQYLRKYTARDDAHKHSAACLVMDLGFNDEQDPENACSYTRKQLCAKYEFGTHEVDMIVNVIKELGIDVQEFHDMVDGNSGVGCEDDEVLYLFSWTNLKASQNKALKIINGQESDCAEEEP